MSKRLVVLAATTAAALTLSGCALGFDAGTNVKVIPGNGASVNLDGLQIRGAGLVIDKANPTNATFIGTVINKGEADFSVVGISGSAVTEAGTVNVPVAKGSIVQFGYESTNTISLTGDFTPGTWVDVQLLLSGAKPVDLKVMVNLNEGVYADVVVTPAVVPSASPSA